MAPTTKDVIFIIERAGAEIKKHREETLKPFFGYSGHKNKAKRALQMAREMLLEISKELDS